jgi:ABC-type multidrug transport system fused ATPase/permease subunit
MTSMKHALTKTWSSSKRIKQVKFVRLILNLIKNLVSRLNSDITVVQDSLSTNVSMFLRSAIYVVAMVIIIFIISPILAITLCVGIIPSMIASFH